MSKIAFITEGSYTGKVPRDYPDLRTDMAWQVALKSDHIPISHLQGMLDDSMVPEYDLAIVIIPKNTDGGFHVEQLKGRIAKKVAVMQEGPSDLFQDYPLELQVWYYNNLRTADIIFTHNRKDKEYIQGLTCHADVRILSPLMIEDSIKDLPKNQEQRNGVIIGGNFCKWYGGFDSYVVGTSMGDQVWAPSMGRKKKGEEALVKHLPYLNWKDWMFMLNEFKYAVHLMRTQAAGTFALNCAYLGIPCIGYKGLDTQEHCHPSLTVEVGDLAEARQRLMWLKENPDFYGVCSYEAQLGYKANYKEDKFTIGEI